jgi:hypothetical protein
MASQHPSPPAPLDASALDDAPEAVAATEPLPSQPDVSVERASRRSIPAELLQGFVKSLFSPTPPAWVVAGWPEIPSRPG